MMATPPTSEGRSSRRRSSPAGAALRIVVTEECQIHGALHRDLVIPGDGKNYVLQRNVLVRQSDCSIHELRVALIDHSCQPTECRAHCLCISFLPDARQSSMSFRQVVVSLSDIRVLSGAPELRNA